MRNSKSWIGWVLVSLAFGVSFYLAPAQADIQQPARFLGIFKTNDCGKANAQGFLVSAGSACGAGGGATIAATTNAIVGDGAGNGIAATGTGTNCVLVNGSSGPCGSGSPTPVLLSHTFASGSSAASTPPISTVGATLIVINAASGDPATITDFCNGKLNTINTWVPSARQLSVTTFSNDVLFVAVNPMVCASHVFTITGISGFNSIEVAAFSGTLNPYTQNQGAAGASASTVQPGTITPGVNGSLLITGYAGEATNTMFALSNTCNAGAWSITDSVPGVAFTNYSSSLAYCIQTTAAAVNPTWTVDMTTNENESSILVVNP